MKRNRKIIKVVAIAILGVFTITNSLFSQGCCSNSGWTVNSDTQMWNYNAPAEYDLTAEQISKINQLRKTSNEKISPIENELRGLKMEYRAAQSNPGMDTKKIKLLRNNIRDKEEKIEDINLNTRTQIKQLLNKNQLTYFNNNHYTWWDIAENCWNSGNMETRPARKMMTYRHKICL